LTPDHPRQLGAQFLDDLIGREAALAGIGFSFSSIEPVLVPERAPPEPTETTTASILGSRGRWRPAAWVARHLVEGGAVGGFQIDVDLAGILGGNEILLADPEHQDRGKQAEGEDAHDDGPCAMLQRRVRS
jgi:hypothetical protein